MVKWVNNGKYRDEMTNQPPESGYHLPSGKLTYVDPETDQFIVVSLVFQAL